MKYQRDNLRRVFLATGLFLYYVASGLLMSQAQAQQKSVASLIANPPRGAPVPPILPPKDGYLFLDRTKFAASFAADVEADTASFMADSQVPWGVEALSGAVTTRLGKLNQPTIWSQQKTK
jgi:hypothetical protein